MAGLRGDSKARMRGALVFGFDTYGAPQGAPGWDKGILRKERASDARKGHLAVHIMKRLPKLIRTDYASSGNKGRTGLSEFMVICLLDATL